ncbi:diacylglycerol kinase [Granulosicoccus sp. 3-233]|uniref:diacylglycerol kinase n=1 Tax=Granulosicoccus sp. 3-233 TaxID=3417969 RepID=UPI003D33B3B4
MQKNTGIRRIRLAGVYAFNGIRAAIHHEAAFRQELILALVFLPLVFLLDVSRVERVLLVSVTALVLIVELVNSAVEAVVDRVSAEHHLLSGRAKDMGSGAVLMTLALWLYVWVDIVVFGIWFAA